MENSNAKKARIESSDDRVRRLEEELANVRGQLADTQRQLQELRGELDEKNELVCSIFSSRNIRWDQLPTKWTNSPKVALLALRSRLCQMERTVTRTAAKPRHCVGRS